MTAPGTMVCPSRITRNIQPDIVPWSFSPSFTLFLSVMLLT